MKKLIIIACLLGACTTTTHESGAELRQVKVDQVNAGTPKSEVFSLLGSPSTKSLYGKETWYYITDKVKRRIIGSDKVLNNSVLAISFNQDQKVDDVQIYGTDDMRQVAGVDKVTPTAGREPTVMDQLLGNVGKFNGDSINSPTGSRSPNGGRPL